MNVIVLVLLSSVSAVFAASIAALAVFVLRELLPMVRSWRRRRVLRAYAAEQTKQSPVLSWHT